MCFKMKTPPLPEPRPAPDRANAVNMAADSRRALAQQQGQYGNIFTSVLGDANYGQNVRRQQVASLGGGAA